MDSKKRFLKNKYWKSKYQPRNASASTTVKKPVQKEDEASNQSEESEEEFVLKQPLPENGWFPDFDSSSSDDDLESLTAVSSSALTSDAKKDITKATKSDENWFDKELDNILLNPNIPEVKHKNIKENESKLKLSSSNSIENEHKTCKYELKNNDTKKSLEEAKKSTFDNEEDELEFLLSLTEPIYTGPVNVKNNLQNERRLTVTNNNSANDKPVKSIDLEKWLDSVLDN